ncbi:trace amine-associated receptor 1-like [Actinia tenebrosa]|uniref:Trace amine-associated receptor 1-like n=1 Tax=Actinia tenebrosa TaxID=6105 RepID=A0A6P8HQF4_ACTTE|nr:trace amine-associated receptor 1-like [Actinia tenebrosa]
MDLDEGVRLSILLVIFLVTFISNASVGVLMYRFKNLRTIPNLIILSSCIADILNQVFNIPGFAAGYIARDNKYFVGRWLALVMSSLNLFLVLVNLMSMTLMILDRLCAFKFNLAYRVWRTRSKAYKVIAVKWISCFVISMLLLVPIWDIDLGNVATYKYRSAYFFRRGTLVSFIVLPFFIVNNAVVGIVTCSVIKHKNKINAKKMGVHAKSVLDQTRKLNEINAIKTIGVTVVVFFVFYLPGTVYGVMERVGSISSTKTSWFGFAAYRCLFLPGLLNPFIYAIRTRRFRRALECLLKDPFGSSEITQ